MIFDTFMTLFFYLDVYFPAEYMSVKSTGVEITGRIVSFWPGRRADHSTVTLQAE